MIVDIQNESFAKVWENFCNEIWKSRPVNHLGLQNFWDEAYKIGKVKCGNFGEVIFESSEDITAFILRWG